MSILTDLQEARELISKKERWTHNVLARDAEGAVVSATSPEACQWCASGALRKVAGYDPYTIGNSQAERRVHAAYEALTLAADPYGVVETNDRLGYKATIKLFDKAINMVKGNT